MSSIRVEDFSRFCIHNPSENSREGTGVVITTEFSIHLMQEFVRQSAFARNDLQQGLGDSHPQSGRYPFVTHITNSKVEVVVIGKGKVIKVTAYLFCWFHSSVQVNCRGIQEWGESLRHHTHLDVMGELQRLFYPLLLNIGCGEPGSFQRYRRMGAQCCQKRLIPFIKYPSASLV